MGENDDVGTRAGRNRRLLAPTGSLSAAILGLPLVLGLIEAHRCGAGVAASASSVTGVNDNVVIELTAARVIAAPASHVELADDGVVLVNGSIDVVQEGAGAIIVGVDDYVLSSEGARYSVRRGATLPLVEVGAGNVTLTGPDLPMAGVVLARD